MTETYNITGMGCAHCKATVEKAIAALKGCENVKVNLEKVHPLSCPQAPPLSFPS